MGSVVGENYKSAYTGDQIDAALQAARSAAAVNGIVKGNGDGTFEAKAVDDAPVTNSDALIKSGGVAAALLPVGESQKRSTALFSAGNLADAESPTWVQGALSTSTGAQTSSTTRIRTSIMRGTAGAFFVASAVAVDLLLFSYRYVINTADYVGYNGGWVRCEAGGSVLIPADKGLAFAIVARYPDNSAIVPAAGSNITIRRYNAPDAESRITNLSIIGDLTEITGYSFSWTSGGLRAATGSEVTAEYVMRTGFVAFSPEKAIRFTGTGGSDRAAFAYFYDAEQAYISRASLLTGEPPAIPLEARYVRFTYGYTSASGIVLKDGYPEMSRFKLIVSSGDNLPGYYTSGGYLQERAATILQHTADMSVYEWLSNDAAPDQAQVAVGVRGDTFVWLTDPHVWHYISGETQVENAMRAVSILQYLHKNAHVRRVFVGGDWTTGKMSLEMAENRLQDIRAYLKPVWDDAYLIIGNHEWNNQSRDTDQFDKMVPEALIYSALSKDQEQKYGGANIYGDYWLDNKAQKIRYFCLGATYKATLEPDQVSWFADELKLVPDGYTVVLLSHIGISWDEQTQTVGYTSRMNHVAGLLDAAKTRGTYTYPVTNPVVHDYSNFGGEIACVISGHCHRDIDRLTTQGIPVIATICDRGPGTDSSADFNAARVFGTVTEQAFDVVQIDTSAKKIYMTRIGGSLLENPDREFSYGE